MHCAYKSEYAPKQFLIINKNDTKLILTKSFSLGNRQKTVQKSIPDM